MAASRFSLAQLTKWIALNLQGAFSRRRNYLFLTPPFTHRQWLFSKRSRKLVKLHLRDHIDFAVLAHIFRSEEYNLARLGRWRDIEGRYAEIIHAGRHPLIVDCGANIGASALYFAEQFPLARVLAIEPQPENFRMLAHNCAARPQIEPLQAAVASQDRRGALVDPGHGNWSFRVVERDDGTVPLVSINTLLARHDGVPFIVKIDIEGFESELFSRNIDWLDRFYVLIIELHDWMLPGQRTSQSFLAAIAGLDRDFLHAGENVFSIASKSSILIEPARRAHAR